MPCKDNRANAKVKKQRWELMTYIDNISMTKVIKHQASKVKNSIYGFSGISTECNIRIDYRKNSNATIQADFFEVLDEIPNESVDLFVIDPLFELYNPGPRIWQSLVKKGLMPKSSLNTRFVNRPHYWQQVVFEKVKRGGMLISKRNIANTNVLSQIPQLWYVHDARPFAHIVRFDRK